MVEADCPDLLSWSAVLLVEIVKENRKLRGNFIAVFNFLCGGGGEGCTGLFCLINDGRFRGNSTKLHPGRFRLVVRKLLFTLLFTLVVKH